MLECDGTDGPTAWRTSVVAGAVRTTIGFGDQGDADLAEETVLATLGYHPQGSAFAFEAGLGALVAGTIGDRDLDPGFAVSATGSWLALPETEGRPFLLLSLSASVLAVPELTAIDLRAGAVVGKTFFGKLTPYVVARAFAGPVFWRPPGGDRTGGDVHHYAFGAGASLRLGRADLFVEGSPLGERSLNAGVGLSF